MHLRLMVIQRSVRNRAHSTRFFLSQMRVGGRQVSAHGADDGAGGVCDGVFGVGVFESRAGAGVLRGLRDGAVVVDDGGVVVGDFGVGDGAACLGVGGVVVGVVGGEDGGGGSYDGADLLGGHGCGCWCGGVWLRCWVVFEWLWVVLVRGEVLYMARKQERGVKKQMNLPLSLRHLLLRCLSPLVVLEHHKLERPRACPANSAYNPGQRAIRSS